MQRAWIYGRDSLSKESLASQIEKLKRFAETRQMEVVGTSSEICLGHGIDRDGLNEAIQMVKDGRADKLLICTLDRISDDAGEIKKFAGQIEDLDAVTFAKEKDAQAWGDIKDVLRGGSPLQSEVGMIFSMLSM